MRPNRFPIDEDKPISWQIFSQLWPYLTEFKLRILLAMVFLIAAKVATIYLPFILKYTVDTLNTDSTNDALILVPFGLIAAYGSLRLANVIFGEIRDTLFGRVTERAMRRLGLKVFKHLHSLDLDFHLNRQTGGLSRDIERGTSGISFLMRFLVFNIGPTLFEIIVVIGVLFYNYGISFALIILASVLSYVAYSIKATDWRTKYVREVNKADSSSSSRAIDSLLNYETVKYFNNEKYEANRYDKDLKTWENARRKNRLSLFALNGGQATIIALSMTSMMALAAYQVAHGKMTIGDFVLINAFTMQIFMPLNFLGFVYREIRGSLANIENLFTLLNKKSQVPITPNAKELSVQTGLVEFKHVNFSYRPDRPILKDVNFNIQPGQKVAVVGESGAGKSTLVKLLFRFYDTTAGNIYVDQQDIKQVSQDSLRLNIGIVPQDTVLFNDSIFENVRYGRPQASDIEVNQAIDLANLRTFIESLPDKQNTKVGERGLKLSGGEKQRVAIARTILKRPKILVFDEATSSLDSQSEQLILKAIKNVSKGHASLVIAHRLSTIIDADNIIVMGNGKILEQGKHSALVEQDGPYKQLWLAQQNSEELNG
ncbi:ABCB family ABC transporter ATP-binding protein/permease [Paraglaciecola sp.]|uniref:ABCB family ABC transporter ATP-binding protein/permease n=1 Tax=Paraglaciecola sp. TaxID=1920173 RepID=UPI003EFA795D